MEITFDNILDQIVKSRTISRKEKDIRIQKFLKEYSGKGKQLSEEETIILEQLKTVRKGYVQQNNAEKIKGKV